MADDKKTIKIDIQTAANTSGLDKATDASKRFLTASEAEVAEVERLVLAAQKLTAAKEKLNSANLSISNNQSLLNEFSAISERADASRIVLYDLEQQITRTGNSGESWEPLVERVKLLPPRLDEVGESAKRATSGVKNLGGFVNQAGFQITDFAIQVQGGQSAITAFSQQFPQLIGAVQQSGLELGKIEGGILNLPIGIGAAVTAGAVAIGIGAKLAGDAYAAMKKDEEDLLRAVERSANEQRLRAENQIKLQNQVREEFVLSIYTQQADELERQEKALQRMNELRSAQGNTAVAQANAAVADAQRSGSNLVAAQGNVLAVGADNAIDDAQAKVQQSLGALDEATEALAKSETLLGEFRSRNDEFSDSYKEADANYKKALSDKQEATANFENQRAIYDETLKAIDADTASKFGGLKAAAADAQTKAAQDALAAIQAKSDELGGNISSNAKQAMADLQRALLDGVVDDRDIALVIDAINQLRASREGADKQVLAGLTSLSSTTDAIMKTLPGLLNRIQTLENNAKSFAQGGGY